MAIVEGRISGRASPTTYGKELRARALLQKGMDFCAAAILLRKYDRDGYVALHNLAQGLELIFKAALLARDFDQYRPSLRELGHDLVKLEREVAQVYGLRPATGALADEMEKLNVIFKKHYTRYESNLDLLIDPRSYSARLIMRRLLAFFRWRSRVGWLT